MEFTSIYVSSEIALALLLAVLIIQLLLSIKTSKSESRLQLEKQSLQAQKQQVQQQYIELKDQYQQQRELKLVIDSEYSTAQQQLSKCENQLSISQQQAVTLHAEVSDQRESLAAIKTELEQQKLLASDKIKTLKGAREQLSKEFELLANRIFDEKTQRFNQHSKTTLDTAISPLREQLKDFKQKVEDVYDKDSKERISLAAELGQLKQLNQQMSTDALNLTNALKGDNKVQGNWGEVILERVLEESGLHKGREYETQVTLKSEQGNSRPDVIIRLPENKDLIIDSKVSLVHYERYCNKASDNDTRQQALKDHIVSVRNHIKELSNKNYENLEGLRTLDFVIIFIPIESAFMTAFEHDQAMFRDAFDKNIIIVGPTTLLATLRTIQSIWRYEQQNHNAEEIARQAGAMYDKFIGFIGDLDKVSDYMKKATKAQDDALSKLSSGRGNLVVSSEKLKKLGAKVKKSLPDSVKNKLTDPDNTVQLTSGVIPED